MMDPSIYDGLTSRMQHYVVVIIIIISYYFYFNVIKGNWVEKTLLNYIATYGACIL